MRRYPCIILLLIVNSYTAPGQQQTIPYSTINLTDLSAFRSTGGNWRIAGDVFYDLKEGGKARVTPGVGILINNPSDKEKAHLFTLMEHGDIEIELDFMMNKNSNSGIYFQGRYELQLFDSWGIRQPRSQDCGAIYERWDESKPEGRKGYEGHPPAQNVSKAPGLWQHYAVHFRAPRFNEQGEKIENARFIKVIHNGVTIHENVEVTGPTRASFFSDEKVSGPLMIQGDHGPVAIRNIRYKAYGQQSVTLSDLKLSAYEGKFNALPDFTSLSPARQMNVTTLEHTGTESTNNFAGRITGTLHIPKTGPYYFLLNLKWIPVDINPASPNGGGELSIGTNKIFTIDGSKSGVQSTIINLEEGDYPLVLSYYKSHRLWYVPTDDIVFAVEAPGIPYTNLNASFKAVAAVGAIRVTVADEPVMLRSFLNHKGIKRTHVISVGEPGNLNYSVDLASGSFLQVWKGDFAETTLMWEGRGEPQLAVPLGSVLEQTGKPSIAVLADKTSPWPDSTALYNYGGYEILESGRPVFKYQVGDSEVRASFVSANDGKKFSHTITLKNKRPATNVWCLAAEGEEIVKMPNGLYSVNKEFYIEIPAKQEVVLRKNSADATELLLPISVNDNNGTVTYSIIW